MTKRWFKLIAILEIVGGIWGNLFVLLGLLRGSIDLYRVLPALILMAIYCLSVIAGMQLWTGQPFGRTASIIIQAIQMPKIVSQWLTLTVSIGIDAYPYAVFSGDTLQTGLMFKFLAYHQLFINSGDEPLGLGISIPACIFLTMLIESKSQSETAEGRDSLPAVNTQDSHIDEGH